MKNFFLPALLCVSFGMSFATNAQELHLSAPLNQSNDYNRMPNEVLCFPSFSQDYTRKIRSSGHYEIWSEQAIRRWAHAQGFAVTPDSIAGGYNYKYGIIFYAPGLNFQLTVPKSSTSSFGWKLVLDMGFLKQSSRIQKLSNDFDNYENILRYDIYIDGIKSKTVELGYGVSTDSPLEIAIPYIRNKAGRVNIEIKLSNHPNNFAILYDAFLTRE